MILYKFWDSSEELYVDFVQGEFTVLNSGVANTQSYIGIYDVFEGDLYAIYSHNGKNYLYLKNKSLEITDSITVKADVNWSKEQLSSFEIYDNLKLVTRVIYKNLHEGILMPFDMIENWEEVNFGYELETLVNKVHDEPGLILFSNQSNEIS